MTNNLSARLKNAVSGPCRYFLFSVGIFAVISAYFIFTKPHFEFGGFEDYPWRILYGVFVIPLAITKALLLCSAICYLYKASLRKNLPIIVCIFLIPISLVWSFLFSDHADNITYDLHHQDQSRIIYLHHTFDIRSEWFEEYPVKETIYLKEDDKTQKYECTVGTEKYFGNLGIKKTISEAQIRNNANLIDQFCILAT